MALKTITSDIVGGAVFSLPWLVARDVGLFEKEGLRVKLVRSKERTDTGMSIDQVDPTGNHILFEQKRAQFQRGCEWGQLRRAHDSKVEGRVIGKRAAIVCQAIMVGPESSFNHPEELSNVEVAVHYHAGSHYMTLHMLEGFLGRKEIQVTHIPVSAERYKALLERRVAAIAVPEPWISLAESQGCKVLCEAFCVGAEVASPEIDKETYAAIQRAINGAVSLINRNKKKYVHYLLADVPKRIARLKPNLVHLSRLQYADPAPYPLAEFDRAYNWMVSWNLIPPGANFESMVNNRIGVAP